MRPPELQVPASVFLAFFVQVCIGFCLLFALVYGETGLSLFSLLVLTMGAAAHLWSRASLRRVDCRIVVSRPRLFPGEKLQVGIQAINAKWLRVLLKIDLLAPKDITGAESDDWIHTEVGLLWYQRFGLSRDLFPTKRGVYDLGPPVIQGGDLFGFLFREKPQSENLQVVVYPRIVDIPLPPTASREVFGVPGARSPVVDPIYIFGTREYCGGRPARAIHWKASARHARLQEKLCEPAEQQKVLLLLDVDGFETEASGLVFEKTIEAVASMAIRLYRRGIALAFAANGRIRGKGARIIPVSRRPHQIAAILETLAGIQDQRVGSVTEILSKGGSVPRGAVGIYFAYRDGRHIDAARAFMSDRRIPLQFVLAADEADDGRHPAMPAKDTIGLNQILVRDRA